MNIEQRITAAAPLVDPQAEISARLERLPVTREVFWARNIVGAATFLTATPSSQSPMPCRSWFASGTSLRDKPA